jgi:hypothetical protein
MFGGHHGSEQQHSGEIPCRMTISPYLPVLRARFFSPPIHHRLSFQLHFNFISRNPEI